jgi:hypothetical protein
MLTMSSAKVIRDKLAIVLASDPLDPADEDLNPHLSIQHHAELVVTQCKYAGLHDLTLEDVYLVWLTTRIFRNAGPPL